MKRYYFGALLLCLAAPACAHRGSAEHGSRATQDQTVYQGTSAGRQAAQVYATEPIGPGATDEMWAADAAEYEKMELPKNSQRGATASSGTAMGTGRGESTSAASSYGDPPGTYTQPGTTRGVSPSQGAQGDTEMANEQVTDNQVIAGTSEQGTSSSDRSTTQRIRRALLDNNELSNTAKNVQVVTRDGNISLRGRVLTERERWEVERIARGFAGSGKVDNYLSIKSQPVSGSTY
jgi:osmotically-inducible protein OsmY